MSPVKRGFRALCLILWLLTLTLIGFALAPNEVWRRFGDTLAADGRLELMTDALITALRTVSGAAGLIFAAFAVAAIVAPARIIRGSARFREDAGAYPRRLAEDSRSFALSVRSFLRVEDRTLRFALTAAVLIGIALRAALLNRPMQHDESYTVVTWASGSYRYAISDYHLPNNHIFHTIFVWLIYHFIGKTPLLIRFPAFLAGCALIPAAFYLGKKFYGERVGLAAAFLSAFSPFLIDYATNARGYSYFALSAVGLFLLGDALRRRRNRLVQILIPVAAALSFYTLPMTLYPFGALCVWFALCGLLGKYGGGYRNRLDFWIVLVRFGLATVVLTAALYLPLFRASGLAPMFDNVFVRPLPPSDFPPTIISRAIDFFAVFSDGSGAVLASALLIGAVLTFVFRSDVSTLPEGWGFALWLAPLILIRRPNLWPRTQIYLFPFLYVWGCAGWFGLGGAFLKRMGERARTVCGRVIWIGLIVWAVIAGIHSTQRTFRAAALISPHEAAVRFVMANEPRMEAVYFAVAPEDDAAVWYYADRWGLEKRLFDRNRPYRTAYVYVNAENAGYEEPRTVAEVVERYGPGAAFLESDSAETVLTPIPGAALVRFSARRRVIEETFGVFPWE